MAKFNFGKGKNKKDVELDKDPLVEDSTGGDLDGSNGNYGEQEIGGFDKVNDPEDEGFFDDDFGIVDSPNDEGDLEDKARNYAEEVTDTPKYSKAEPKWYEKGANIIAVMVISTVIVVVGLYTFREPIRGLIGSGTEELSELDLKGEVKDYQDDVKTTLQSSAEKESDVEKVDVEMVDFIPEGEYIVGKDISAGTWVAKEVLLEIYDKEDSYREKKQAMATNTSSVDKQKIVNLAEGQFIVVQAGELVFNESRPETAVNVGDTFIEYDGEQLYVGKDIPEGFYTFYNLDILEAMEDGRVRDAGIVIKNPAEDEQDKIGVERKTTVFLRKGLIIEIQDGLLGERVSSDGTYGDDTDILEEDGEESKDKE